MCKRFKLTSAIFIFMAFVGLSFGVISCQDEESVRIGDLDSDYSRFGLTQGTISEWEDGMRMDYLQEDFCFEWWYFDGTFSDGSAFVASFYSRIDMDPTKPFIKLTITTPEGENIIRSMWGDFSESSFSTEKCSLNIGENNSVTSDSATTYHIKSQVEDLAVDLTLKRTVHSFRQDTGHILIGDDEELFLAWFSMVPKGDLEGTITYNGETHSVTGMGYHDHNWGNIAIQDAVTSWWWMRGYLDLEDENIAIIAYDFGFKDTYGSVHVPIYGVVNSTDVLAAADSSGNTTITGADYDYPDIDGYESKFASDKIPFEVNIDTGDCTDGTNCIENQFVSETLLEALNLAEVQDLTNFQLTMMKLLSIDPWYTRYSGSVTLDMYDYNGLNISGTGTAIIEYLDLQ